MGSWSPCSPRLTDWLFRIQPADTVVEEEPELTGSSSPMVSIFNKTGVKSPHPTHDRTASRQHIYKVCRIFILHSVLMILSPRCSTSSFLLSLPFCLLPIYLRSTGTCFPSFQPADGNCLNSCSLFLACWRSPLACGFPRFVTISYVIFSLTVLIFFFLDDFLAAQFFVLPCLHRWRYSSLYYDNCFLLPFGSLPSFLLLFCISCLHLLAHSQLLHHSYLAVRFTLSPGSSVISFSCMF
jgi:hypothetical protein